MGILTKLGALAGFSLPIFFAFGSPAIAQSAPERLALMRDGLDLEECVYRNHYAQIELAIREQSSVTVAAECTALIPTNRLSRVTVDYLAMLSRRYQTHKICECALSSPRVAREFERVQREVDDQEVVWQVQPSGGNLSSFMSLYSSERPLSFFVAAQVSDCARREGIQFDDNGVESWTLWLMWQSKFITYNLFQ